MEVYSTMRTTFAARQYTDDTISDEVLYRILDNDRFAPSGGNRQGWRVLVVKDKALGEQIKKPLTATIKQYKTLAMKGETSFCTVGESNVSQDDNKGLGGLLTTFLADQEEKAKPLLSIPDSYAIAAMIGIGKPVENFTWVDTFAGDKFDG